MFFGWPSSFGGRLSGIVCLCSLFWSACLLFPFACLVRNHHYFRDKKQPPPELQLAVGCGRDTAQETVGGGGGSFQLRARNMGAEF